MSFLPPLPLMLIGAFVLGLSWGPFNPFMSSLIQRRVPERDHGLIFGAQTSVFYAAPPIGMVITGVSVEALGTQITYHAIAGLMIITALLALASKALRDPF